MPDNMRLNKLVEMFESHVPAIGIFAFNLGPKSAAAIASTQLDFVIVDMEHAPFEPARLEAYLLGLTDKRRILEKGNLQPDVVPVVRIPSNGPERLQYTIKQVLDLGVFGVVAPRMGRPQEALAAVRAMRFAQAETATDYEPQGERGVGYPWAARYWGLPGPEYAMKADLWPLDPAGELLLWCMIETRQGVENCQAIVATPGVSGILIGPSDLSFSLEGFKGGSKAEANIQKILAACKEANKPCGVVTTAAEVAGRIEQGFSFLAVGTDLGLPASVEAAIEVGRQYRKNKGRGKGPVACPS